MALIFLAFPAAVYVSLCLLPRGRLAAIGIGFAAAVAFLRWATAGADEVGEFHRALALIAGAAIAAAAVAQGIRRALGPGRPGWLWPATAGAVLLAAFALFLAALGVH